MDDVVPKGKALFCVQLHFASPHQLYGFPLLFRNHWAEVRIVILHGFVFDVLTLHLPENTEVERIFKNPRQRAATDRVGVDDRFALRVLRFDLPCAVHFFEPGQYLREAVSLEPHPPALCNNFIMLGVRIVVAIFVSDIPPLVTALGYPFFKVRFMPTGNNTAQSVAVFLGNRKKDAQHHFAGRSVVEVVCAEFQIYDFFCVDEIDNGSRLQHVPAQTIRVPTDNSVDASRSYQR